MRGLRPIIFAPVLAALCLASCNSLPKDAPPPSGTLTEGDGAAARLFSEATALEAAGKSGKAEKTYDRVATKYRYSKVAPEARFRQAVLLDRKGEILDAFDAYEDFIQNYPSSSLYTQALSRQAVVAHAAADGQIKNSFLGLKSRLDPKKITEMLGKVRENAPQAPSAPKAQFAIGEVWESEKRAPQAIDAFEEVIDNYSTSTYAPEAQYRIGAILLNQAARGNQNQANLDRARHSFEDLLQQYPGSPRDADARARLREIASRDVQRSFDIAEFYFKKGEQTSAAFYYKEVIRNSPSGTLHDRAQQRLAKISGS
ncbi:MAG: outer membrane protein assembly factor BamD [Akkermansiaceae bacterium]|nr:outer membrane protein assembly factor BamD [Akkermansiaceae bacterium]NNM30981.1 outer membrane protein assembly factor BamD [Akkermansiaceae bacterium]